MLNVVDHDWRLTGQEQYLQDAAFVRKRYRRWSTEWDHDHCDFCMENFVEAPTADLDGRTEGYGAVGRGPEGQDDYYWVCDDCFSDFRARFGWKVISEQN
jgi:hypothetical protein